VARASCDELADVSSNLVRVTVAGSSYTPYSSSSTSSGEVTVTKRIANAAGAEVNGYVAGEVSYWRVDVKNGTSSAISDVVVRDILAAQGTGVVDTAHGGMTFDDGGAVREITSGRTVGGVTATVHGASETTRLARAMSRSAQTAVTGGSGCLVAPGAYAAGSMLEAAIDAAPARGSSAMAALPMPAGEYDVSIADGEGKPVSAMVKVTPAGGVAVEHPVSVGGTTRVIVPADCMVEVSATDADGKAVEGQAQAANVVRFSARGAVTPLSNAGESDGYWLDFKVGTIEPGETRSYLVATRMALNKAGTAANDVVVTYSGGEAKASAEASRLGVTGEATASVVAGAPGTQLPQTAASMVGLALLGAGAMVACVGGYIVFDRRRNADSDVDFDAEDDE
jgi:LPXTG-motif cell wall-anchored protein